MIERMYRPLLVVLSVCAATFPTLFPEQLQKHNLRFVALSAGLAAAAISWQLIYESREARKAKELSHKLELQKSRSLTLTSMIKILTDPIILIEQDQHWTPEQRQKAVQKLNEAMTQILRALSKDVSVYVDEKGDPSINTNLMVAHAIANSTPELLEKLSKAAVFLGFGRQLSSYAHGLELFLWGREESDIPPLVLPVEDPRVGEGRRRLLPGAPTAFALDEDRFIPDTHRIREYLESDSSSIGSDLGPDVLKNVEAYFVSKQFRSFASLVLRDPVSDKRIGVLNIQSDHPGRFRTGNDMKTLIESLEHYRFSLQYLLNGQRKLLGIVT